MAHESADSRRFADSMIRYFDITVIFLCYALLRMLSGRYGTLPDATSLRPGRDVGAKVTGAWD